jgi:Leucine-rich repeat (LRR) protein
MKICIEENEEYDTGIHSDVTEIVFKREIVGDFFKEDRFPKMTSFICFGNKLTELKLNCPSLQELKCSYNQLTKLKLNCPSLQNLDCSFNKLTKLELTCSSLQKLECHGNILTKLNLNCPSLRILNCSSNILTILELYCPSLQLLCCDNNPLANLNGLEFCEKLNILSCSHHLEESVEILRSFLPNLIVNYQ